MGGEVMNTIEGQQAIRAAERIAERIALALSRVAEAILVHAQTSLLIARQETSVNDYHAAKDSIDHLAHAIVEDHQP